MIFDLDNRMSTSNIIGHHAVPNRITRHRARRGHGSHGSRSRPRLCRRANRRDDSRVLHTVDHALLRPVLHFSCGYTNFTFAGVIWAIGWCMVVLAGLVFLPTARILRR
jgi:hypothetical protein